MPRLKAPSAAISWWQLTICAASRQSLGKRRKNERWPGHPAGRPRGTRRAARRAGARRDGARRGRGRGRAPDAVDEDGGVDLGPPRQHVPGRYPGARQEVVEHRVERRAERGPAVERNGTPPLADERGGQGAATGPRFGQRGSGARGQASAVAGRAASGPGDLVDGLPGDVRRAERVGPTGPDAGAYECHDSRRRSPAARRGTGIRRGTAGEDQEHSIGVSLSAAPRRRSPRRGPGRGGPRRDHRQARPERGAPAQRRGRVAHGGDGVSGVVLAVAEGALAVLPGLAPVDRGQTDEEDARRATARRAWPPLGGRASHGARGVVAAR